MAFDDLYKQLLKEAEEAGPTPPSNDEDEDAGGMPDPSAGGDAEGEGSSDEINIDDIPGEEDMEEEESDVNPEEIELARMAIRALHFNIESKDVHQFKLKLGERIIPFDKIADFFESSKQWKPILSFLEFIMDKFEGTAGHWAKEKEINGKPIIQKLAMINRDLPAEEKLPTTRRVYWVRIILNCILHGKPSDNTNIGDVDERNLDEVFSWLKMHYGSDTRGEFDGINTRAPGVF